MTVACGGGKCVPVCKARVAYWPPGCSVVCIHLGSALCLSNSWITLVLCHRRCMIARVRPGGGAYASRCTRTAWRGSECVFEVMFTHTRAHAGDSPLSTAIPPSPPGPFLRGRPQKIPTRIKHENVCADDSRKRKQRRHGTFPDQGGISTSLRIPPWNAPPVVHSAGQTVLFYCECRVERLLLTLLPECLIVLLWIRSQRIFIGSLFPAALFPRDMVSWIRDCVL